MERRSFIKTSALSGSVLLISLHLPGCKPNNLLPGEFHQMNGYLSISTNSHVTIYIPTPEIGQGVRTALSMLVIEELGTKWDQVQIKQCDAGPDYGERNQRAAGSNSVKVYWEPLRRAGAQAREMLKQVAANEWNIPTEKCSVKNGKIENIDNSKKFEFGDLVEKAILLDIPTDVVLKDSSEFELIGTSVPNKDIQDITAGAVKFGMDISIENMLYASIERCPTYGGKVLEFDASEALDINGVVSVFKISHHGSNADRPYTREGLAVIGTNTWAVLKGRKALKIEWNLGTNQNENTDDLKDLCEELIQKEGDDDVINHGDVYKSLKEVETVLDVTYKLPFIAHIPMEPVNCTINLTEDRCELWSGTQMPYAEWQFLANYLEMPEENITLHVPRIGGGYGRRLGLGVTIEAVKIAQEIKRPVKLFWTREDDIVHDSYRPLSYHRMKAGLNNGKIITWLHRQAGTSRYAFRSNENPGNSEFFPNHFPANLIPNFRQEYSLAESNIPRSLIRAPGNNALAFVVESFIDELAHESQTDPLQFRLELLGEDRTFDFDEEDKNVISTKRMKDVLKLVADKSDWHSRSTLSKGRGLGIAAYFTFDTYVAHVAEVSVDKESGKLIIHKFVSAVDCGQIVNMAGVKAQVEGAIIDGISATLHQEITVQNGAVQQSNFHDYHVLRCSEAPLDIEVYNVESNFSPTGMGEPPYPPVAPALCNAIFAATGNRIRTLPIASQLNLSPQFNSSEDI